MICRSLTPGVGVVCTVFEGSQSIEAGGVWNIEVDCQYICKEHDIQITSDIPDILFTLYIHNGVEYIKHVKIGERTLIETVNEEGKTRYFGNIYFINILGKTKLVIQNTSSEKTANIVVKWVCKS